MISLSDAEILAAKAVVDAAGVGCEPASAASVAGVKQLVADGTIPPDARVASILTGNLLKDPETTIGYHEGSLPGVPAPPTGARQVVEASLEAIGAALADLLPSA